jgi:hypothetical protein
MSYCATGYRRLPEDQKSFQLLKNARFPLNDLLLCFMRSTTALWSSTYRKPLRKKQEKHLDLLSPAFLVGYRSACLDIFMTTSISNVFLCSGQAMIDPPCAPARPDILQGQQCRHQQYRRSSRPMVHCRPNDTRYSNRLW